MYAQNIMKSNVSFCTIDDTASKALAGMLNHDCGFMPVTQSKEDLSLVGVITDRDIAMYMGRTNEKPSDVKLSNLCARDVHSVHVEDDIHYVIRTMEQYHIRRVPVVNDGGKLVGVISLKNLADEARSEKKLTLPEITSQELATAVEEIERKNMRRRTP